MVQVDSLEQVRALAREMDVVLVLGVAQALVQEKVRALE